MLQKPEYIIGIDEVGRGPLAGPVCVCAAALSAKHAAQLKREMRKRKLADSKQLTALQREAWLAWMREKHIPHAIAYVHPQTIDRIHIHHAVNRAAQSAYGKLMRALGGVRARVIADGSIHIRVGERCSYEFFPKADELVPAVSLASIAAKVSRDARMSRLHTRYIAYDFLSNKGYGTRSHIAALRAHGPSKAHRLTFLGSLHTLQTGKNVKR